MENNKPEQMPKTVILIDGCLSDIEAARREDFTREVYNSQHLFGGFKVTDPGNSIALKCKPIAEACRNNGKSYDEMLDAINEEAMRLEKIQIDAESKKIRQEQHKVQIQQEKQRKEKKRKIKTGCLVAFAIISIMVFAWDHHVETVRYNEEYDRVERMLIEKEYMRQMQAYNEAVTKENEKTESDIAITVSDYLDYNNSVGDDWYYEFYVNDTEIGPYNNNIIHVKFGDAFTIESYYAEDDSWPDSGYSKNKVNPTKEQLISGFEITQETTVRENHGRYTGNTAKWITTYELKAIMNYPDEPTRDEIVISEEEIKENMWISSDHSADSEWDSEYHSKTMVYYSDSDIYYHTAVCSDVPENCQIRILKQAQNDKKIPCPKCNPPQ